MVHDAVTQLSPHDPFWPELLKGFGLPHQWVSALEIQIGPERDSLPRIGITGLKLDDKGHLLPSHDRVSTWYTVGLRKSDALQNANWELLKVLAPRLGLPDHVVSLKVKCSTNALPVVSCEFHPEPFNDAILADGKHVRDALGPFELTPVP